MRNATPGIVAGQPGARRQRQRAPPCQRTSEARPPAGTRYHRRAMTVTAQLLISLELISHETTSMLDRLDKAAGLPADDRREAKRQVLAIRMGAQELFDWLSAARLEMPRN